MKQKSFEEFNWKYYGIIWLKIFSSEFEKQWLWRSDHHIPLVDKSEALTLVNVNSF